MASWLPDGCLQWLTGPAGQIVADTIMEFTAGNITDPQATAATMEEGAAKLEYSQTTAVSTDECHVYLVMMQ